MESIEYTSYIGECCQKLADIEEYQSDVCLMHLVRLQHVAQSIRRGYAESDAFPKSKVPVHMYVKALQADLKDFKSAVPLDLQQNSKQPLNLRYFTSSLLGYSDFVGQFLCRGNQSLRNWSL